MATEHAVKRETPAAPGGGPADAGRRLPSMLCVMALVRTLRRNVLDRLGAIVTAAVIAGLASMAAAMGTPAFAAASPWSDHDVVAVRLVAGGAEGGTALLGLHFRLAPEWHVYWKHPGDAGAAPEVVLTLDGKPPPGPLPTQLAFPAPKRFALPGGLEALGYQGEVVYPMLANLPAVARGELHAVVDYVACAVECIPYHDELQMTLDPAGAGGADEALLRQWLAKVPRARGEIGLDARLRYYLDPEPELEIERSPARRSRAEPNPSCSSSRHPEPRTGRRSGARKRARLSSARRSSRRRPASRRRRCASPGPSPACAPRAKRSPRRAKPTCRRPPPIRPVSAPPERRPRAGATLPSARRAGRR